MPRLKPVIVASANRTYLELVRRGWRTHHLDGRIAWMEPPVPAPVPIESPESVQLAWLAEHYRGVDPAVADADELADWEAEQEEEAEDDDE